MNRTEEELRQFTATANAITNLALNAERNVEDGEYDAAGVKYALITELSYALATTMQKAATNNLKSKFLPEDLLEGLPSADGEGHGNYI